MYVYNVHTTVNVAQVSVIFLRMVFFNSGGGGGGNKLILHEFYRFILNGS